jgi:hypothetical protein
MNVSGKSIQLRFVIMATLALGVAMTGCGDSDGEGGTGGVGGTGGAGGSGAVGGTGGTEVDAVTADPAGEAFEDSVEVRLTTDSGDPIYYTTDLTPVLDEEGNVQGTEYTGPITIEETTVLKFLTGTEGDYSAEQWEGYTNVTGNPIRAEWAKSGHGDIAAEAWRHWDEDGEVSPSCAKCHGAAQNDSPPSPLVGFLEYAATGDNTRPVPLPLGLDCVNCHRIFPTIYSDLDTFGALEPVRFPSEAELSLYSSSNICATCHQGRESGQSVEDQIASGDPPYRFLNIHYYAAAGSLFGSEANAGYQYPGKDYRPRNTFPSHPDDVANCVGCHMKNAENDEMHTWKPAVDRCNDCHSGSSFETLQGSPSQSLENISALVLDAYGAIQDYAETEIGVGIEYNPDRYPYWFDDQGGSYSNFDAALLKAAYNYQVALKDPAGFIHNGTYIQQILYDSIDDLGGSTAVEVIGRGDLSVDGSSIGTASKTQQWQISAHGAAGTEPFRHWDEDYEDDGTPSGISAACTKCHSPGGFAEFAMGEATTSQLPTHAADCWTCHNDFDLFDNQETRYDDLTANPALANIEFPSGATASFGNASNICMSCHQGRESGQSVENATPNNVVQAPEYESYDFINIHYYAAAATLFGSDVNAGYEYPGKEYRGKNEFIGLHEENNLVDCIDCHMNSGLARNPPLEENAAKHTFVPIVADCNRCHSGSRFQDLSGSPGDNFREIEVLKAELLAAMQAYATTGDLPIDSPVLYDASAYPYWFKDNGQGATFANRYRDFDFPMLTAAYNYTVASKDPAGYIHNGAYIEQLLYDSILAMGGTPTVVPPLRP